MKKMLVCLSVMFFALLSLPRQVFPVYAEEETETQQIQVDYVSRTSGKHSRFPVPYSDRWFCNDATTYNHDLARASIGFAVSAFRPAKDDVIEYNTQYIESFLSQAGFSNFRSDDYDRPAGRYTIASEMASKTIEGEDGPFTMIAIGIAGQGYQDEWLSNFSVGDGEIHNGFMDAADDIYDRFWGYLAETHIEKPFKVWVTGFSRAAAVANIFAAYLEQDDLLPQEDVFAYTFATPRTTKNPEPGRHQNIFNIVGALDPVPQIPFQDWGFGRYGQTFYTLAQETNSSWFNSVQKANKVYREIVGYDTWNNPVVNTQIKVVTEYLLELCPDNKTYAAQLQNAVCELWNNRGSLLSIMKTLFRISENENLITPENEDEANSLFDYVLYNCIEYLLYPEQMGHKETSASAVSNIMHEHTSEVYLGWMLSDTTPEELFSKNRSFTKVSVSADADVDIYEGETLLQTITKDGEAVYHSDDVHLFMSRAGLQSTLFLPSDADYRIVIRAPEDTEVDVIGINYTSEQTRLTKYMRKSFLLQKDKTAEVAGFTDGTSADVSGRENIEEISSNPEETLSRIQRFETLNVFDLQWRDFVIMIFSTLFSCCTVLICTIRYVAGKIRWMWNVRKGLISRNVKYYALPIFCIGFAINHFLVQQVSFAIYPPTLKIQLFTKLHIGILLLVTALHGYLHSDTELNYYNLISLALFTAQDAVSVYSEPIALAIRIAAEFVMLYGFVKICRPVASQYVILVVLLAIDAMLITHLMRHFNIPLTPAACLLAVNVVVAAALFTASIPMPSYFRTGSFLMLVSCFILYAGPMSDVPFGLKLLLRGVYYLAITFFAAASVKLSASDSHEVLQKPAEPAAKTQIPDRAAAD